MNEAAKLPANACAEPHWTHLALRALLDLSLRATYGPPINLAADLGTQDPDQLKDHEHTDFLNGERAEAMRKAFEMFGIGPVPAGHLGATSLSGISSDVLITPSCSCAGPSARKSGCR